MIMISYLLLFALFTLDLADAELGYTYSEEAEGWLKLHNIRAAKWDDASVSCLSEGAVLASPLTSRLRDAILNHVQLKDHKIYMLYTGIHANNFGDPLVTREGVPVRNLPVPTNFSPENTTSRCVMWGIEINKLLEVHCDTELFYVCYKSQKTKYNQQDSLSPNITEYTGSNYSAVKPGPLSQTGQSRSNPTNTMRCAAEKDTVIIINTDLETEKLREIINRSTKITIIYANQAYITHLDGKSEKVIDITQRPYQPSFDDQNPNGSRKPDFHQLIPASIIPVTPDPALVSDTYPLYYTRMSQINGRIKLYGPATWIDAKNQCIKDGATLASPLTRPFLNTLKMHVLGVDRSVSSIHTGVHANFSTGDYISIEGVLIQKMPVVLDQSQHVVYESSDSCLALMTRESQSVRGVKCSDKLPFVCYKKRVKVYGCGTEDKGYEYKSLTGSCYKFHRNGLTWSKAFEECNKEGAYLAVVDNQKESQVLSNLFTNNPQHVLSGVYFVDNAFIGLSRLSGQQTWMTTKNTNATYLNWNTGEPNNARGIELCVSIHRRGTLYDEPCLKILTFICEKTPELLTSDTNY